MADERSDPVNFSTLKHMLKSPLHYLHALAHPPEETDAMRLGRAIHCAVYEPEAWRSRYVVSPRFHRGRTDKTAIEAGYDGGKDAAQAWELAHLNAEVITYEMFQAAEGVNAALKSNPLTARYIVGGKAEQRIEWKDDLTGIDLRGTLDYVAGSVSDLKTCANIEPRAVARTVGAHLLHMQIGLYVDGLIALGHELTEPPALIFAESCKPHDSLVLTFTEEDVAKGRALYRSALDTLAECRATGVWPGVAGGKAHRVQIPEWSALEEEPITMGGASIF